MSICEGIAEILAEQAKAQCFNKVTVVWLEVGQLSTVEPSALRFSFDVVMRGTLAEGARLEIIEVPGQAWCMACSETVSVGQRFEPCPRCGSYQLQVTSGGELRVKELEVSGPDPTSA
jgi:hydrogenase nickel incorporation protein HypA/HybF